MSPADGVRRVLAHLESKQSLADLAAVCQNLGLLLHRATEQGGSALYEAARRIVYESVWKALVHSSGPNEFAVACAAAAAAFADQGLITGEATATFERRVMQRAREVLETSGMEAARPAVMDLLRVYAGSLSPFVFSALPEAELLALRDAAQKCIRHALDTSSTARHASIVESGGAVYNVLNERCRAMAQVREAMSQQKVLQQQQQAQLGSPQAHPSQQQLVTGSPYGQQSPAGSPAYAQQPSPPSQALTPYAPEPPPASRKTTAPIRAEQMSNTIVLNTPAALTMFADEAMAHNDPERRLSLPVVAVDLRALQALGGAPTQAYFLDRLKLCAISYLRFYNGIPGYEPGAADLLSGIIGALGPGSPLASCLVVLDMEGAFPDVGPVGMYGAFHRLADAIEREELPSLMYLDVERCAAVQPVVPRLLELLGRPALALSALRAGGVRLDDPRLVSRVDEAARRIPWSKAPLPAKYQRPAPSAASTTAVVRTPSQPSAVQSPPSAVGAGAPAAAAPEPAAVGIAALRASLAEATRAKNSLLPPGYHVGPRGGVYRYTSGGNKKYV
jgi:hypothetical protein